MKTPLLRPEVELGEFVIMPNHFHAIVHIIDEPRWGTARRAPTTDDMDLVNPYRAPTTENMNFVGPFRAPPDAIERFGKPVTGSIPTIVRAYKSAVTKLINELRGTPATPVWQRNYWDPSR